MILLAALLAGAVPATVVAPLSERVPEVATRFCIDLLSRSIAMPVIGDEERRVFARYGLSPGIPNAALQTLGRAGASLVSGATLASGDAGDGAFVVALGGAAGETCRIIVYRAPADGRFVGRVADAMKTPGRDWRWLPASAQSPEALRISYLKRADRNAPFIATLTAPAVPGPIALVVNVAAVPQTVSIPEGY